MVDFIIRVIVDPSAAARGTRDVERNLNRVENSADRLRQTITRAFAFVGIAAGIRQLVLLTDQFTLLQNRLRTVTADTTQLAVVTDELFAVANRTRGAFRSTAEIYARAGLAARNLGVTQQELLQVTESLNQAVILSGAGAQEANNALIQLSQGLASNTLRGDELRSVLEQLPVVADVIAESLGVTRGELRELGAEGQISAEIIINAFAEAREDLEERFGRTVPTIAQSFVILNNNLIRIIGTFNESSGAAQLVSQAIILLAENLDSVIESVSTAVIVLGTVFALQAIPAVIAGIRSLISTLIALRAAFFALQIPIVSQVAAFATLVIGIAAYTTNLFGANRETQRFIERQQSLASALRLSGESVNELIDEIVRLSAAERELQLQRLGLAAIDLEGDLNEAVESVNRFINSIVSASPRIAEAEDQLRAAAVAFSESFDVDRLILDIQRTIDQVSESGRITEGLARELERAFGDLRDTLPDTVQRLEDANEILARTGAIAVTVRQAVLAVGDAYAEAAEVGTEALDNTADATNVLARSAVELQRARFIDDDDIRSLRELERGIELAELRTQTFNDVLEQTESRFLANAAAIAVVTARLAELNQADRLAEQAFTDRVSSLERELTLRGLVATEQTAAAEALERESAAIDLRNQLTADAIEVFGGLSEAQTQAIEDLVALQDQTIAAEQAQRRLNAARDDPQFVDFLDDLARENQLIQLNRREREALSAVLRIEDTLRRQLGEEERAAIGRLVEENQAIRDQIVLQRALSDIERQRALLGVGPTEREILGPLLNLEGRLGRALTGDEREDVAERLRANQALADQRAILDQLAGPLETYRRGIAAINSIQADTAGGQERLNALARDLRITYLDTATDVGAGFERGFLRAQRSLEDFASSSERLITDAFSSAQDVLVEFFQTGELNAQRFFAVLSENFLRLGTQQLFAGAFGEQGLNIGGLFGEGGFDLGSLFDFGSLLGFQRGVQNAPVDSLSVASIGGVDNRLVAFRARSDETVSVNRPGESGQRPIQIIQNISTPDVEGFRRSEGQILARTQAALQRANQRNN